MNKIAAINLYKGSGLEGFGPLGFVGSNPGSAGSLFEATLSKIVGVLTVIAFIWFLLQFVIGAISWISAGSDAQKVEGARAKLTNAFVGLLIVIAAVFIAEFVGLVLGVDILRPTLILNI